MRSLRGQLAEHFHLVEHTDGTETQRGKFTVDNESDEYLEFARRLKADADTLGYMPIDNINQHKRRRF